MNSWTNCGMSIHWNSNNQAQSADIEQPGWISGALFWVKEANPLHNILEMTKLQEWTMVSGCQGLGMGEGGFDYKGVAWGHFLGW